MEQQSKPSQEETSTEQQAQHLKVATSRRSFLSKGLAVGGAGVIGAGLLPNGLPVFAEEKSGSLTKGDIAILRFLSAAEILET
ncbi:MAG: twin-arginine translocation signal domain-containing protein, partial [Ktedonobacteraceae bacterium]